MNKANMLGMSKNTYNIGMNLLKLPKIILKNAQMVKHYRLPVHAYVGLGFKICCEAGQRFLSIK